MKNEIYSKILVYANDSSDGETPTRLVVTEEANCFAVWKHGYDGQVLMHFERHDRNKAIEWAVNYKEVSLEQSHATQNTERRD